MYTSAHRAKSKKPTRQLIAICSKCKEPVIVRDAENTSLIRLGRLIRRANRSAFDVRLVDDLPEASCTCPANQPSPSQWARFSVRQILFVMTTFCVVLAIFRHPLSMMFDEAVWKSAIGPWSVIGNLLMGTPIIDPRPYVKTNAVAAAVFTISTPAAVLTVWFAVQLACQFVYRAWLDISDD